MDLPPTGKMLFLDDCWIGSTARLSRFWNQPERFGSVLEADKPWERRCVLAYGGVIHDGGLFRMWYQTFARELRERKTVLCYAESDDGIRWRKPVLNLCECEGTKANNVVIADDAIGSFTVTRDDEESEESRRYKALYFKTEPGVGKNIHAAFSPDGLRWTPHPAPVMPQTGDRTTLMHDPSREAPYVAFTRGWKMMDRHRCRIIYRAESTDFVTWTPAEPILFPDLRDSWDVQLYGMPAFRYEDVYLGGLQVLRSRPDTIHTELVVSRDTYTWKRSRSEFLGLGMPGAWDSHWASLAPSPPVRRTDGSLWFFHEGRDLSHERLCPFPKGAVGLVVLPEDRFCALEAGPVEGILTTKPFLMGGGVTVNVAHRPGGAACVRGELIDERGEVLPGFAREDSVVLGGGPKPAELSWGDGKSGAEHRGRFVSLRLYIVDARLFAALVHP